VAFFRRGGFITPTQERPRRASSLQKLDPYTLTIALDKKGNAKGELYIDDGESFNYRKGEFVWRGFEAVSEKKGGLTIRSTDLVKSRSGPAAIPSSTDLTSYDSSKNSFSATIEQVRVEQIVILGLSGQPKSIKTGTGKDVGWGWTDGVRTNGKKDGVASTLILKDPGIKIVKDWSITVEL
jgi:alpha 1,3-glucosidase